MLEDNIREAFANTRRLSGDGISNLQVAEEGRLWVEVEFTSDGSDRLFRARRVIADILCFHEGSVSVLMMQSGRNDTRVASMSVDDSISELSTTERRMKLGHSFEIR